MKTSRPISLLRFSPFGTGLVLAMACIPLVVPAVACFWFVIAPEGLWRLAEQLWPFTLAVTSLVAVPKIQGVELPVHELVYAILLAGWAIAMPLHAILLFRFRHHVPAWVRSKIGREAERMQTAKPWALPVTCLLGFAMMIDILLFGQIYSFACFGVGYRGHGFGPAMFYLGGSLFLFYIFGLGVLQRIVFRAYRDTSVKQVGTER